MIVLGLESGYPVGVEDVLPKLFDVEIFHLQPLLLLLLYDGFGLFGGRDVFLHEEPGKVQVRSVAHFFWFSLRKGSSRLFQRYPSAYVSC